MIVGARRRRAAGDDRGDGMAAYRAAQRRQARRTVALGLCSIVVYLGALLELGLRATGH